MSLFVLYPHRSAAHEEDDLTATYTFDVFSSLDGYGAAGATWTGYWGKQGPELLDHRLALYGAEQRSVFGANTYRAFARMLASSTEESEVRDPWITRIARSGLAGAVSARGRHELEVRREDVGRAGAGGRDREADPEVIDGSLVGRHDADRAPLVAGGAGDRGRP